MKRVRRFRFLSIALLAATSALPALAEKTAAGHWEGTITVEGAEQAIAVDLDRGKDGAWKGELDVPGQAVRNLGLESITVDGSSVSFRMSGVPGEPTFKGAISEDRAGLSGTLTQLGQSFPFKLARKGNAQLGAVPEDGVKLVEKGRPGKGAEGEWHGALDAGPSKLRLIVHVSKGGDGALTGTMDSVDQGATAIAIDRIVFEEGVLQFEISAIPGSYKGTMSPDGSRVTGAWSQGGTSLPLELLRSGK